MKNTEMTFVGRGGGTPGIDCVTGMGRIAAMADFDEGYSIYGIQFTSSDNTLIAGSRTGHIKQYWHDKENDELVSLASFYHGSPVVSVMRSGRKLHSIGCDGTGLVWNTTNHTAKIIQADGYKLIALEPLSEIRCAGLTENGKIIFLNNRHQITDVLDGPVPCSPCSLTRLLFWQKQNVLVYPATDGALVVISLNDLSVKAIEAHNCGFVSVFSDGNSLYTSGFNDGKLKRWSKLDSFKSFDCQHGIVSGCCFGDSGDKIGMIDKNGDLFICSIGNKVEVVTRKSGNWRCFMKASGIDSAELYDQRQQAKAEKLQQLIFDNINKGHVDRNCKLYSKLEKMGYHKAILALKSTQFQVCGDVVNEFKVRHQLCRMVSKRQLESEFLHRYMSLTMDACLLDLADDITNCYSDKLDTEVVDYVSSLKKTAPALFDITGWDFEKLSMLWSLAGKTISGQFVFERGTPLSISTSDDFITDLLCHLLTRSSDYQIVKSKLLDNEGSFDVELLVFDEKSIEMNMIQIFPALLRKNSNLYFVLIAEIDSTDSDDICGHNETVAKMLNKFSGRLLELIDDELLKNIHTAIQKTLNERNAES